MATAIIIGSLAIADAIGDMTLGQMIASAIPIAFCMLYDILRLCK